MIGRRWEGVQVVDRSYDAGSRINRVTVGQWGASGTTEKVNNMERQERRLKEEKDYFGLGHHDKMF